MQAILEGVDLPVSPAVPSKDSALIASDGSGKYSKGPSLHARELLERRYQWRVDWRGSPASTWYYCSVWESPRANGAMAGCCWPVCKHPLPDSLTRPPSLPLKTSVIVSSNDAKLSDEVRQWSGVWAGKDLLTH